ncbi:hypothetical protein HHL23_21230 [Chryseobacterium sp. RP-3-3]|uniref:Uncharacterized protein n=1 Tax=Chryseobacterium antibioticum TaxID=2728847 RepID=A0A7Y0AS02_9FLAO|nr:hypothetical protein [Chryseobacterium antibioticum]NML72287.1 hypothetical protein [Chryseobacterium antibioticum]
MAYCYHCGRSGAYHRRNVVTGHSSSRHTDVTYTGPRFLCNDCVLDMEKEALKSRIVSKYMIILFLVGLIYFFVR